MKKLLSTLTKTLPAACAALAVIMANVFAGMPCHGPYYEPELPEELRK